MKMPSLLVALIVLCSLPVLRAHAEDQPPQPLSQTAPEYPARLKKTGITGTVVFTFVVTPHGRVADVHIIESPDPAMSDSVLKAVATWRFTPPIKDGKRVAARMKQRISFKQVQVEAPTKRDDREKSPPASSADAGATLPEAAARP